MRTSDDLVLDVMPLEESILGFTNRWYALALDTAELTELEPGVSIRAITAPAFLATKWEAYRARGADDPIMSRETRRERLRGRFPPRPMLEPAVIP